MGRPGRVPFTRELVVAGTPFVVIYRVRADVEIVRVLHGAPLVAARLSAGTSPASDV
jgi:toxin ParE1/3/4